MLRTERFFVAQAQTAVRTANHRDRSYLEGVSSGWESWCGTDLRVSLLRFRYVAVVGLRRGSATCARLHRGGALDDGVEERGLDHHAVAADLARDDHRAVASATKSEADLAPELGL